jgi:predicted ester cyclase
MIGTSKNTIHTSKTDPAGSRQHHQYTSVADYILGITFEIWEQKQVDDIYRHYSDDVQVYSLDSYTHGAAKMVTNTHDTLKAYPDRLLLGDAVICSGNLQKGFSSHRITSPMTNTGPSVFGPATNRQVRNMNIADCEINHGQITREWLVRDNLALVKQLGFDPIKAAQMVADRFDNAQTLWLQEQYSRTLDLQPGTVRATPDPHSVFAQNVLESCWVSGNQATLEEAYAPYAVLHRAPKQTYSGITSISTHFADWRKVIPQASITVDHICSQPLNQSGREIAVRWSVAGQHQGAFSGCDASNKPLYILGVTHWRIIDNRIVAEWTVFDELAVMAQTLL